VGRQKKFWHYRVDPVPFPKKLAPSLRQCPVALIRTPWMDVLFFIRCDTLMQIGTLYTKRVQNHHCRKNKKNMGQSM